MDMDNQKKCCALCRGSGKYVCSNPLHSSNPSKCPRQSGLPKYTCPDCHGRGSVDDSGTARS
jgi:hypothetical protein